MPHHHPVVRPLALAWAVTAACGAGAQETPPPAGTERPLWEIGVAGLVANGPDYPAAGTRRTRGIAAPVFVYRGSFLRADDDGVRGLLLQQGNWTLDVSAAAAFNARDNEARAGMPDLDYLFQLGPQAVYRVNLEGGQTVSAHTKLRAVASTDFKRVDGRGWVAEQEFRWAKRGWPDAASSWVAGAQFFWAGEKLHDYFYQVEPSQARAGRPAYEAEGGYFGSALRAGYARRITPTLTATAGVTLNLHAGAANRDSPLFQKSTTSTVVLALVWMPWRSETMVSR